MDKLLKKESIGGGDIKLLFLVGLYSTPLNMLLNILLSCIIGLITIVAFKKDKIPFGPTIAISTYLCLMFGERIIGLYLNLFF